MNGNNRINRIKRRIFGILVVFFIFISFLIGISYYKVMDYYNATINKTYYVAPNIIVKSEAPAENSIGKFDYYPALNDNEKRAYDQVSGMLKNFKTKVAVDEISISELNRVLYAVQGDHPEYFWVGAFSYLSRKNSDSVTEINVEYPYEIEEKNRRQAEIDADYDAFSAAMPGNLDEYGKVKYVYDYIVKNTEYVVDPPEDQNIYSVFGNNASVCAGYAKSTQYLLKRLGMDCSYVAGEAKNQGPHAWNLVQVDGDYYYLDATWGEFSVTDNSEPEKNISYDYFCVTTADLLKTHTIDEVIMDYPELTATAANYFVRAEKIFDLDKKSDQMRMTKDIETAKNSGEKYYYFKLTDQETLRTAENLIADVLGSFTWYMDEDKLSKTVVLY
ncbi:MAG: transglutaminase domain-containing protein [Acetobacterium sp.]